MERAFEVEVTEPYTRQLRDAMLSSQDRQERKDNLYRSAITWLEMLYWLIAIVVGFILLVIPLVIFYLVGRARGGSEEGRKETREIAPPTAQREVLLPCLVRAARVGKLSGCRVFIWSDEHPPPHFHVKFQSEEASFSILTGERLPGTTGLKRYEKQVRLWWRANKSNLISTWNATRPTDCPVGPIVA